MVPVIPVLPPRLAESSRRSPADRRLARQHPGSPAKCPHSPGRYRVRRAAGSHQRSDGELRPHRSALIERAITTAQTSRLKPVRFGNEGVTTKAHRTLSPSISAGSARGYLRTHSRSWPLGRPLVIVQRERQTVFLCIGAPRGERPDPPRQGFPGLPWCAGVPVRRACRTGTVPLAVGLIESHGAGASGSPGRDARMPPGSRSGLRDGGCRPGACGPRAIRAGRRTPARDHPAGPGSDRRPDAPERRGEPRRGPGSAGVQEGAAARCVAPCPGITLSDERGQEERAHSRRYAWQRPLGGALRGSIQIRLFCASALVRRAAFHRGRSGRFAAA